MPRWLRVLILFLMVLSLVIYISPLQVEASSIAASIAGVTAVNVPAGLVVGATFIALGLAAAANPEGFQNMVDAAVSALDSAGTWVKDGMVELFRTEDSDGNASYYVDSGLMEDIRQYSISSGTVYKKPVASSTSVEFKNYTYTCSAPASLVCFEYITSQSDQYAKFKYFLVSTQSFQYDTGSLSITSKWASSSGNYKVAWLADMSWWRSSTSETILDYQHAYGAHYLGIYDYLNDESPWGDSSVLDGSYSSDNDISLGVFPSVPVDGTSARAWSEDMTDNGLYVVGGSNDPDPPDENNGKWFWPIALALTAADLIAMSQSDQWSGITPGEFDNYEESQNYYITPVEVSFGQGIEISPVTNPDTGGDTGEDTETDPDTGGEVQTDYTTWFSRLYTTVENISGKFDEIKTTFQTWITDCSTAIEAIPSKFADWFANLKTSVDTFASNAQDAWSQTVTSIQSLPASIADSLAGLMPDADPEPNPPSDLGNYTIDLKDFFPFCIPFDLYDFFTCLNADPVAPVIEWEIYLPGGEVYPLVLDLSVFDTVALLLRRLQLLLFCTGLAFKTRDLIRG